MGAASYTNQLNLARVSTSYAPETIRKLPLAWALTSQGGS